MYCWQNSEISFPEKWGAPGVFGNNNIKRIPCGTPLGKSIIFNYFVILFEQGVDSPLIDNSEEIEKGDILLSKFELKKGSRDFEKINTGINKVDFTLPLILTPYNRREKISNIWTITNPSTARSD